jgi:hypothetical protein
MYVYVSLPDFSTVEEVYIHLWLFNDVVGKSEYMASNERIFNE